MPGKSSKIKLDAAFAKREPTKGRARLLPGGWWLWCLLGLGIGLGVWIGGRHHLRRELKLQLTSAQSGPEAIASIDALMRLDGDAAIDVARALAHRDLIVAHAAYRALNEQLDAWRKLEPAERTQRLAELISQLESVPSDCDQDHRILVTGLASRLYAEALSSREPSAAEMLDRCRRIIDRKAPPTSDALAVANIESSLAEAKLASITSSLDDAQPAALDADGSVPAPLLPIESSAATAQLSDSSPTDQSLTDKSSTDPLLTDSSLTASSQAEQSTSAYSDPTPSLAPSPMPRMSSLANEAAEPRADAARLHLTGAPSRQATLVDRRAPMTLSNSDPSQPLAADQSSRNRNHFRQEATAQESRDAAAAHDSSGSQVDEAQTRTPTAANRSSPVEKSTAEKRPAEESRVEADTLADIDRLSIDELVRLLSSQQPRVAQAAALALRGKGLSDDKLALAMQLAVGSSAERLELLQSLVQRGDLDPRPWLLWMAADGDQAVREQAIGMLAPLLDQDVRRRLRLLLSQERDERIAQTIRRVLVQ